MYYINKIIGGVVNPLSIGLLLIILAIGLSYFKKYRTGTAGALPRVCGIFAIVWLWFWSTTAVGCWLGLSLERKFPPQRAESYPSADAIVILGGGASENTNACLYAELSQSADRAWHGARLYKAGRAPKILVTSAADAHFLIDLGVPREAIQGPSLARNTEEEAKALIGQGVKRILLVTSAWHMRRAQLMYARYAKGVEVIPAATDHEATMLMDRPLELKDFLPDPGALGYNAALFKEHIAYWGYRWLRR